MSSRDPAEELAEALRRALASAAGSATSESAFAASAAAAATAVSLPPVYASPMAVPAPYSGTAEDCNGFLLQCSLTLEFQAHLYPDDRAKIAFTKHFKEVFGRPEGDPALGESLCHLKQGNLSVAEYALQFRTLAAASGWNEQALITTYRQGLNLRVRLHLAAYEDSMGLEKFIQLSIRFATRMQLCLDEHQSQPAISTAAAQSGPVSHPEPPDDAMQLELSDVSSVKRQWERQRRLAQDCCFYCGSAGHFVAKCPLRPARAQVSTLFPTQTIRKPLSILASITAHDFCVSATALLDSGSAGNFISGALCRQLQICLFHQSTVQFLGYIIDRSAVRMDEKKVTAVRDWPTPTTVKELQRFLGFANFYRRFINGYSSVTSPLTDLLRNKPKALIWTPAATHAFQTLKQAFTTAPLLVHPDPERPFIVEVDASTTGVGAVLSQQQGNPRKLHPCAFFSRKLNSAKMNYDIGNWELLAIKLALEEWRHWLEGTKHPFTVLTDHKNLEYLRAAKRLNPCQARWFTISHRPGAKNVKADALSRLYSPDIASDDPEPILPENIFVNPISWSEGSPVGILVECLTRGRH
ncbi:hypothetical protein QTP86_009678 [Hemibagrus guttatus]|nr:hypothetical protein QTP86_009678 [Hemibagrus guttatus]